MATEIATLSAADTHRLRRIVLRDGTPSDAVEFEGDDLPTTLHLGIVVDGEPVAISTWLRREYAGRPGVAAVQLRGMATEPGRRGAGLGRALLREGVERARADGAALVWARARVAALPFYVGEGFTPVGDEYVDATTALAHHDIVLDLAPSDR